MHSLALPQRKVPFVLPRRHSSSTGKTPSHSASAELVCRLPRRSNTTDVILSLSFPRQSGSDESSLLFPPSPRPSGNPRRSNSEPNSSNKPGHCQTGVVLQSAPAARLDSRPRRCQSEPNARVPMNASIDDAFQLSSAPLHPKNNSRSKSEPSACLPISTSIDAAFQSFYSAPLRPKGGRSRSEPSRRPPPECDVLRAYREALYFHEKLRHDYETAKRLFVLYRYKRLRSLIRNATVEQQLNQLRRATRYECSCNLHAARDSGYRRAGSVDAALDGKLEELVEAVRPTFNKVKACVQSAWGFVGTYSLLTDERISG